MNNDETRRRLRRLERLREERQMRVNGGAAGFANNVTAMSNSAIAHEIANLEAILPRRVRGQTKKKKHTKSERWEAATNRLKEQLKAANIYQPSQLGLKKHKNRIENYTRKAFEATFPRTRHLSRKRPRPGVSRSASSSNSKNSKNNLKKGFSEFNLKTMANVAEVRRQLTPPRTALSGVSHNSQSPERRRRRSRSSSRSRGSSVGSRSRSSPGSRTPSNSNSNASRPPSRA